MSINKSNSNKIKIEYKISIWNFVPALILHEYNNLSSNPQVPRIEVPWTSELENGNGRKKST